MAGKICPNCGKLKFFETPNGRKCSKCNYEVHLPPNNGKGGLGTRCSLCSKQTVFNGKCTNCGAKYTTG